MSHQGSEGQQAFTHGDPHHQTYNGSTANGVPIEQRNTLMVNPPLNMSQNNMMQNNAVTLGIVQQQQQMPMLWKAPTPIVPDSGTNLSTSNNQKHSQMPGPFAAIVSSSGMISMNSQVEPSPPIAPGSAPNIISSPEQVPTFETGRTGSRKGTSGPKAKTQKGSRGGNNGNKAQNKGADDPYGKTEKNRERNREHARSTRLRKKAYIQKLKDMAQGLRAVQTKEIRERRISMQNMMNTQKVRRAVVQTVLDYHAGNERDPTKWNAILENTFWMKQPVTPFRSFKRAEIDRDFRIVRGIDAMICDAASIAVMVERIGRNNARWRRIKRNDFLETLDDRDILNQEMEIFQQPESSLSSESSTDSSQCSGVKMASKRKRAQNTEGLNITPKVSSSSESGNTQENNIITSSDTKTNTSSSDEADKETSAQENATNLTYRPPKVARKNDDSRQHPILSRMYLNRVSTERISAFYAVNQDDMILLEDVLMCPFVFRTKNAVLCGALAGCVIPGMLRANFSKNNKLLSMELVFDAMGFMQQLDSANGNDNGEHAIPNSLETAILPCPHEARVITEATPPYSIVHVNESWTRMTKYSQSEAEGNPLLNLLQNKQDLSRSDTPSHDLEEVQRGQPTCSTNVHFNKDGRPFVDFMCSYPLTNATDQITHFLHVNIELPQTVTLIS